MRFAFALAVLFTAAEGHASIITTIDQQSLGDEVGIGMGTKTFGQSFTPKLTRIDAVEINMLSVSGDTTWRLDVLEGDGLGGSVLGSSAPVTFSNSSFEFVHFDMQSSVNLTPGSLYTLRLSNLGGSNISVTATAVDTYKSGQIHLPFASAQPKDLTFVEGVHAAAIPEPATCVTFSGLVLCFGLAGCLRSGRRS